MSRVFMAGTGRFAGTVDKNTWKTLCYIGKHNKCKNQDDKCGCPCHG